MNASDSKVPMLAQEWTQTPLKFPVYLQPKLDGIRCLVYSKDGKWVFQSRTGLVFQSFPHLEKALGEGQVLDGDKVLDGDEVLDGELYSHDLEFHQITSMVRKKNHPDLSRIQYHVYDILGDGGFEERFETLPKITDPLFRVETVKVHSLEEIEAYHTACVAKGYEGIMIRTPGGKYKKGRSKDLLKYKHFKTDEFRVVGHAIGKGDIPVFECETAGGRFSVMMKSTLAAKREMLPRAEDYYGQWLTVKYQELSPAGIPRFPVGIDFRQSRDGKTGVSLPAFI
jgi:DNA ligase-1